MSNARAGLPTLPSAQREFMVRLLKAVQSEMLGVHGCLITDNDEGLEHAFRGIFADHLAALDLVIHMLGGDVDVGSPSALGMRAAMESAFGRLPPDEDLHSYFETWARMAAKCGQLREDRASEGPGIPPALPSVIDGD